jgi:hypothetical protein
LHPLVSNLDRVATVHSDRLAIQVLAADNEQNCRSHIAVIARTLTALAGRHLRGEHTRCDAVDAHLNTVLLDLGGQHLVEMDRGGLAGVVGEVVLRDADVARDTADVDNGARVALVGLCGLLDEGEEGCAHEERADDICLVTVEPLFFVGGLQQILLQLFGALDARVRLACGDAGVVDEYAEALLP